MEPAAPQFEFHPLTSERWDDFEKLFGPKGAYGGCWCMWWRIPRSQFWQQSGEGNRLAMKDLVEAGNVPGLLAYQGQEPVGWCSLGRREDFPALERSRSLKKVDDQPVWSIVCFYIAKPYRRKGLTLRLIQAAKEWAKAHNAVLLEAYPRDQGAGRASDASVFTGLVSAFRQAHFTEVIRRTETRPVMRFDLSSLPESTQEETKR